MALFDASKLSNTDIPPEMVSAANTGIDRLRARLVREIRTSIIPKQLIRSSVQIFFQGQVRRALMFIDGAHEEYLAGRGLVAYSCARAIYETVACVLDFCDKLTDHLVKSDFEKTAIFLHARTFAARANGFVEKADGFDNTATNILTQIDRLSRHRPGLRDQYYLLSEKTHPNVMGSLNYFWESGDEVIQFSNNSEQEQVYVIRAVVSAGALLLLMEEEMSLMEKKISKVPHSY
jgi:hypothetical protein